MNKINKKVIDEFSEEEKKAPIKRKLYDQPTYSKNLKNTTYHLNNRFLLQNSLRFEEDGKFIEELEGNMIKIETNKDYLKSMYSMLFKKDKLMERVRHITYSKIILY